MHIFERVPPFCELDEKQKEMLLEKMSPITFKENEYIVR
jgi:hypothetical protein